MKTLGWNLHHRIYWPVLSWAVKVVLLISLKWNHLNPSMLPSSSLEQLYGWPPLFLLNFQSIGKKLNLLSKYPCWSFWLAEARNSGWSIGHKMNCFIFGTVWMLAFYFLHFGVIFVFVTCLFPQVELGIGWMQCLMPSEVMVTSYFTDSKVSIGVLELLVFNECRLEGHWLRVTISISLSLFLFLKYLV